MKRIFTLFAMVFMMSWTASAQLADGSIAPNWTLTDINGTEHTLYDYLDQGYSVVLDFSATWCGPCWSYHNSGALEDLYVEHGPTGLANVSTLTSDDVMVFMIEGDNSTNSNDLAGTGSDTQGDWITGTPYPIIDDGSITSAYAIAYWPTIYTICPDGTIQESSQVQTAAHLAIATECGFAQYQTDLRLLSLASSTTFCGGEYSPIIRMQNLSLQNITAATIVTSQGGTTLSTFDWTGDMATYGTEMVVLPAVSIDENQAVDIEIVIDGDEDMSNNAISETITLSEYETGQTIILELMTDTYGSETDWEFVDEAGNVLASGGGYPNENPQLYTETVTLPALGCYTFNITDAYGDGICCDSGIGFYKLKTASGDLIVEGGAFESAAAETFKADFNVAVEDLNAVTSLNIFPNPASSDEVTVSFGLTETLENTTIEIYNIVGQQVAVQQIDVLSAGVQNVKLNVADLQNGIYMVTIASEDKIVSRKLQIQK